MQNSKDIGPPLAKGSEHLTSSNPINFYLRNDNSSLLHIGVHRDTTKEDKSVSEGD